jgi:hypothetical protein
MLACVAAWGTRRNVENLCNSQAKASNYPVIRYFRPKNELNLIDVSQSFENYLIVTFKLMAFNPSVKTRRGAEATAHKCTRPQL